MDTMINWLKDRWFTGAAG